MIVDRAHPSLRVLKNVSVKQDALSAEVSVEEELSRRRRRRITAGLSQPQKRGITLPNIYKQVYSIRQVTILLSSEHSSRV